MSEAANESRIMCTTAACYSVRELLADYFAGFVGEQPAAYAGMRDLIRQSAELGSFLELDCIARPIQLATITVGEFSYAYVVRPIADAPNWDEASLFAPAEPETVTVIKAHISALTASLMIRMFALQMRWPDLLGTLKLVPETKKMTITLLDTRFPERGPHHNVLVLTRQ